MKTRTEQDKIGCLTLPADALYGIHTARAIDNFALEGQPVRLELIHAMVQVKKAAALTNRQLHQLEPEKADAIVSACDAILLVNTTAHSPPPLCRAALALPPT